MVRILWPLHFSYTTCLEFNFLESGKSTKYHISIGFPDDKFVAKAFSPEILILFEFKFGGCFEWDFWSAQKQILVFHPQSLPESHPRKAAVIP